MVEEEDHQPWSALCIPAERTTLTVADAALRDALVHNEVFTATGTRTQRTLHLSTLAKGSYTLQVQNGGGMVSQTVVVE
jgi:hypothetical protein